MQAIGRLVPEDFHGLDSNQQVPVDTIEEILDLARRGPSAGYTQGQDFIIVTDPATRQAIADNCGERYYIEKG